MALGESLTDRFLFQEIGDRRSTRRVFLGRERCEQSAEEPAFLFRLRRRSGGGLRILTESRGDQTHRVERLFRPLPAILRRRRNFVDKAVLLGDDTLFFIIGGQKAVHRRHFQLRHLPVRRIQTAHHPGQRVAGKLRFHPRLLAARRRKRQQSKNRNQNASEEKGSCIHRAKIISLRRSRARGLRVAGLPMAKTAYRKIHPYRARSISPQIARTLVQMSGSKNREPDLLKIPRQR